MLLIKWERTIRYLIKKQSLFAKSNKQVLIDGFVKRFDLVKNSLIFSLLLEIWFKDIDFITIFREQDRFKNS